MRLHAHLPAGAVQVDHQRSVGARVAWHVEVVPALELVPPVVEVGRQRVREVPQPIRGVVLGRVYSTGIVRLVPRASAAGRRNADAGQRSGAQVRQRKRGRTRGGEARGGERRSREGATVSRGIRCHGVARVCAPAARSQARQSGRAVAGAPAGCVRALGGGERRCAAFCGYPPTRVPTFHAKGGDGSGERHSTPPATNADCVRQRGPGGDAGGARPCGASARAQERNGSNGVSRTPGPVPARPSQPAGAARRGVLPRAQPPRESLRRPMPGRAWRTAPCCCPPPAATLPVAPVRAPLLSQQRPRQATGATAGALSRLGARACAAFSSFQGGDAARGAVCESERADGGNACMMINIHYSRRGALQSHVRAPAAA